MLEGSASLSTSVYMDIGDLPNELLLLIFEAGHAIQLSILPKSKSNVPFEMIVSHVSRKWRELALRTPQLWTCIEIRAFNGISYLHNQRTASVKRRLLAKVAIYDQRSLSFPLHIDVDMTWQDAKHEFDGILHPARQQVLTSVLPRLKQAIHRWASFSLTVVRTSLMATVLREILPTVQAPLLNEMALTVQSPSFSPLQWMPFHDSTPALRRLSLDGVCFPWTCLNHFINLHVLRLSNQMYFPPPDFPSFARSLRDSPNLETLVICSTVMSGSDPTTDPTEPPVELPSLIDLAVTIENISNIRALFIRLVASNLHTLSLRVPLGSEPHTSRPMCNLVYDLSTPHPHTGRPSLEPVKALYLRNVQWNDPPTTVRLFRALPNLLVFATRFSDATILDLLANRFKAYVGMSSTSPVPTLTLCPLLRVLILIEDYWPNAWHAKVLDVLEQRRQAGAPVLRVVCATRGREWPDPGEVREMARLVEVEVVPRDELALKDERLGIGLDLRAFLEQSLLLTEEDIGE